ncbi:hypothetical protein T10_5490 [Trichinella papuae]|uniref:Uncharacterized protein n=1 Tax=Trichinella papuae TaxID=268474 RepID=A0A0V1MMS6_9BILA|nr:hypothetical protein T10_5490 [Trichinella papuae]
MGFHPSLNMMHLIQSVATDRWQLFKRTVVYLMACLKRRANKRDLSNEWHQLEESALERFPTAATIYDL